MAEICYDWCYGGGWSLWWWLWDRKLGACLKQLAAAVEQLQQLHMCPPATAAASERGPRLGQEGRETTAGLA